MPSSEQVDSNGHAARFEFAEAAKTLIALQEQLKKIKNVGQTLDASSGMATDLQQVSAHLEETAGTLAAACEKLNVDAFTSDLSQLPEELRQWQEKMEAAANPDERVGAQIAAITQSLDALVREVQKVRDMTQGAFASERAEINLQVKELSSSVSHLEKVIKSFSASSDKWKELEEGGSLDPPESNRQTSIVLVVLLILLLISNAGLWAQLRALANPEERLEKASETVPVVAEPVPVEQAEIQVLNGVGRRGLAGTTAHFLEERGAAVPIVGNAASRGYRQTTIFLHADVQEAAEQVAAWLGIPSTQIRVGPLSEQGIAMTIVLGEDYRQLAPF